MANITLTINKQDVFDEVAKTSSYTGKKLSDETAYDRIFTTDEDAEMLERFWDESKNTVCDNVKRKLYSVSDDEGIFTLKLSLSQFFDDNLVDSMNSSLFSFFVMNITSKWFTLANKEEAAGCAAEAATYMEDVLRKAYYKKKPTRPTYV